jgi:hypothetical protein
MQDQTENYWNLKRTWHWVADRAQLMHVSALAPKGSLHTTSLTIAVLWEERKLLHSLMLSGTAHSLTWTFLSELIVVYITRSFSNSGSRGTFSFYCCQQWLWLCHWETSILVQFQDLGSSKLWCHVRMWLLSSTRLLTMILIMWLSLFRRTSNTATFDIYSPYAEIPTIYPDQLHKFRKKGGRCFGSQVYMNLL